MTFLQVLLLMLNYFADDIDIEDDIFVVVNNSSVSASSLNNDLEKIWDWTENWKMLFNPDSTKQANKLVF